MALHQEILAHFEGDFPDSGGDIANCVPARVIS
jgi:hypothetical protein